MANNLTTTGLGVAGVLQAKVHELICRVEAVLKLITVNPTNASSDIARR